MLASARENLPRQAPDTYGCHSETKTKSIFKLYEVKIKMYLSFVKKMHQRMILQLLDICCYILFLKAYHHQSWAPIIVN